MLLKRASVITLSVFKRPGTHKEISKSYYKKTFFFSSAFVFLVFSFRDFEIFEGNSFLLSPLIYLRQNSEGRG